MAQDAITVTQSQANTSQIFAVAQQVSSHVDENLMQQIVHKANDLDIEHSQLVVDLLGMALEGSHHLLKKPDRILLLLTKLASSANLLARNRIINLGQIIPGPDQSPNLYSIPGEPPVQVEVMKQGKKGTTNVFGESLIIWAHLSHANILPVYGAFLQGEGGPISLVSPRMIQGNMFDYATTLPQSSRMPLISDAIDGLCYLHNLKIVHGALNPQNFLVSHDGRALITGFDDSSKYQDVESSSVRYSAPEMLSQDNFQPNTASDMWALGCIVYEVFCGKAPFHHIRQEGRVGAALVAGQKPFNPHPERNCVGETNDSIWGPASACWEFEAKNRPNCLQFQKVFSSIITQDERPEPTLAIQPRSLEHEKGSAFNFDLARSILIRIIGSDLSMPPPSKIPEHLQKPLFGLADNNIKAETIAVVAKKLSPSDTQILVDVLDLIIEENSRSLNYHDPVVVLLRKVMMSTHIFPQPYRINFIRYDPAPIVEGAFGKVCKGRDIAVCVSVITGPQDVSEILEFMGLAAHSLHSNILPLYGVFHEVVNEIPRLCLVTPYLKNGLLYDYAARLPQEFRLPLISDVIKALVYLRRLSITYNEIRGDSILVSDDGRAMIACLGMMEILRASANTRSARISGPYILRFYAPERVRNNVKTPEASAWSFGCLMFEVLSRKPPYHQYTEVGEIRSALFRGEVPKRPSATCDDTDAINDQFWDLIMACCTPEPGERLPLSDIQKQLEIMKISKRGLEATGLPGAEALALRSPPDLNWIGVKQLLDQIQVELLRTPLSKLIQNHTKDVAATVAELDLEDTRTMIDFLDLALKNRITLSDERNRVLALLSRITTSTLIFPHRYELKGIEYHSSPIAVGGFGTVHRGVSDPKICVKVMVKLGSNALMGFVKEQILWAHSSHPNILPFYGVFVDEFKHICLVSPFMNKGNLHEYAPPLPQIKRIPLLYDVIKGLVYLHGIGIVHTDLKAENVMISDEGRGLITDFGASHVITTTAKGGAATASIATTLRFTAPEIVLNRHSQPTQECDIWSFGCLCYEVLSRKLPYFEYNLEAQIVAALSRKQPPKRPSSADDNAVHDEDWDEFDRQDWDEIDDPAWNVVTICCAPKPTDRPNASRIQELIMDLKMWDDRPDAKDTPGSHLFSLRSNLDINLSRAGELLDKVQVRILARSTLLYPTESVIEAVAKLKLGDDDARVLVNFWDLVLQNRLFTSREHNEALALLTALIYSTLILPYRYILLNPIKHDRASIGSGSFGEVHRATVSNLCIKVTNFTMLDSDFHAQWLKTVAPLTYAAHPNILPFYGTFLRETGRGWEGVFVFPFMMTGNLYSYALDLPEKLQVLLISDIIEALVHLHGLGVTHGNLKGENVLISDEGRALVTDFRPYHINVAASKGGPIGSYVTSTLRFTAPELVKNSQLLPTTKSDIWSIGCLVYFVLSRKVPFYQYSQDVQIRSALLKGELPALHMSTDDSSELKDLFRGLIIKCCAPKPDDRPTLPEIQKRLASLGIQDNRPPAKLFPGAETLRPRSHHFGVDVERVGDILARIKTQLPLVMQDGESEGKSRAFRFIRRVFRRL